MLLILNFCLIFTSFQEEPKITEAEEAVEEHPQQITTQRVKANSISIATTTNQEVFLLHNVSTHS